MTRALRRALVERLGSPPLYAQPSLSQQQIDALTYLIDDISSDNRKYSCDDLWEHGGAETRPDEGAVGRENDRSDQQPAELVKPNLRPPVTPGRIQAAEVCAGEL